jgi:alpha-L-fucosidase
MRIVLSIFLIFFSSISISQNNDYESKMDWFEDAKLGIFIHWGIYSRSLSFFNLGQSSIRFNYKKLSLGFSSCFLGVK